MESRRLRIAPETRCEPLVDQSTKCIRLRDLLNVLRDANGKNLAWLDDFSEDPVEVTNDLYEVLSVYQQLARAA